MRRAAILLAVLSIFFALGCRQQGNLDETGPQTAEDFGRLPGLKRTPRQQLRNELARIIDEQATPELLSAGELPEQDNAAATLAELFLPSRVPELLEESGEIFPKRKFTFNPVQLQKAINFRSKYDSQRRHAREALDRPRSNFTIRYQTGFEADLWFVDMVRICVRLEAFQAAESLSDNDPATAVESLQYMLRLAACLAAEKHVTCRLEAALARREAWAVLQTIVEHPEIALDHLQTLHRVLQDQLASWPADSGAWIGDRALGMYAYELVRVGRLADLLTNEETRQFASEGILKELPEAAMRTVDQDELYYLNTMRRIIDSCGQPYYARVPLFDEIRGDLHAKRNSPEFPPGCREAAVEGHRKGTRHRGPRPGRLRGVDGGPGTGNRQPGGRISDQPGQWESL